jgi:signal transduction histidine kinase
MDHLFRRPHRGATPAAWRVVRATRAPSRFARRAAARAGRNRDRVHVELVARLLEVADLPALVQEIVRGARSVAQPLSCTLVLRDARPARGPARPGRRSPAVARRTAGTAGGATLLLPLRHRGRTLGVLRAGFRHTPPAARSEALRRYLEHAAAALARVAAEQRARRQHARFGALLDNLPDACLLMVSPSGTILDVRGRAPQLVGADPRRWVGAPLANGDGRIGLLRLPRGRLRQTLGAARTHGRAEIEAVLALAGRDVPVSLTLVALRAGGEMVAVLRDLTAVKAMEAALRQRNDELTQAAERLREIDVLKNEFLSNVSHELRTPLTAIIAYTEALLRTPPDAETQREFLRVIAEQGHKLQRLIGGLLEMSKLESLATELKLLQGSLNDVVRAAIVTVKPTAAKNGIAIVAQLDPELPSVWLDELRAQQIVWNLLTNAVKFSPPDTTVRVRTWNDDTHVWAAVSDQGIGIAPEHQALIFEKFVQLDGSSTRRHGGVGLGLDLVKHLVDLHGGSVRVESEPDHGATFTFSIPIEKRRRPRLDAMPRNVASARS